ncbi:MAG: hypothetical protein HY721_12865 [Planctomycetes bacterium]|nr:hypothetical protein [Planctomycetota bacterium]
MAQSVKSRWQPGPGEVLALFREEVEREGGRVLDAYAEGDLLVARGEVPGLEEPVRRGDAVRGGVAIRTKGPDVLVHPFTYRLVCKNGAVRAHALETRRVQRPAAQEAEPWAVESVETALREAVRASLAPEAFREGILEMRAAAEVEIDRLEAETLLQLLELLQVLPMTEARSRGLLVDGGTTASFLARSLVDGIGRTGRDRRRGEDATLFGLMNEITAAARDDRDVEERWRLEELGGAVGALALRPRPAWSRPARSSPACPVGVG